MFVLYVVSTNTFETRISASASSWMQKEIQQELEIWLKIKNSSVLSNHTILLFFCTEFHRGDITTTQETFPTGIQKSKHVNLGQGFTSTDATVNWYHTNWYVVLTGIPVMLLSTPFCLTCWSCPCFSFSLPQTIQQLQKSFITLRSDVLKCA